MFGILICARFLYVVNRPEYMAGRAERIPDFFSMQSYDNFFYCIDELHSQGRKFEDFGSAHYELRIKDNIDYRKLISKKESITETDSTIEIKIRRGDIDGTFVLMKISQKAYVHYYQIYND